VAADVRDVLGELVRCSHREVDAQHHEPERRPLEVVGRHPDSALPRTGGLSSRPSTDAGFHGRGVGLDVDHDLVAARHLPDRVAHERSRVVGRKVARRERRNGRARLRDAVDAEGAPVVAVEVVREEVPPSCEDDQAVRLDVALRCGAVARGVRERKPHGVVTRAGNDVEDVRRDRGRRLAPRREHRRATERVGALAQPRREQRQRLRERADRRLCDPCDLIVGRGVQPDDERDGFVVVEHERR